MHPLLKHLVEMTGHRDHSRLELSVISALHQVADVSHVRLLEIFNIKNEQYLRPRIWVEGDSLVTSQCDPAADEHRELLSKYPGLEQCLRSRTDSTCLSQAGDVHLLWLPVWLQDKVACCVEIRQDTQFTEAKLGVIDGIFQVYQNYQSLLDYSERDALTGLLNRKTFDEQFAKYASNEEDELQARAAVTGQNRRSEEAGPQSQWLAVVDIDHFKLVNDRFGHLYGDEVLILIANILKSSFRSQDRVFRFGGEEFVVLLRSSTLETAHRVFNRFRTNVEQYDFPQVGKVTVSLGFVSTQIGTAVEILGHADQALYFAKQNGRNRICFYDELVEQGLLAPKQTNNDDVELF